MRNALLWASQNKWLETQFRKRAFAKKAVARFMPGETADDALAASAVLAPDDIGTILTQLGENLTDMSEADDVLNHYMELYKRIADRGLDAEISVKLTQLGLDLDAERAFAHLQTLAGRARDQQNFLWVDMEASPYADRTIEMYTRLRESFPNVGVCLQAYLFRTAEDLEHVLRTKGVVRLVKGAYNEPATVAFAEKRKVDDNYFALAMRAIDHARGGTSRPHAIATHDMTLIDRIREAQPDPSGVYEINMLYGIRSAQQKQLSGDGVPTRVLVSYGSAWFAWYMRRLAERPANIGFVLRTMFG